MRIPTLLQKIAELSEHPERRTAIDVDLLLDYTRVLYADLLEWRSKLPATLPQAIRPTEPTLDELAARTIPVVIPASHAAVAEEAPRPAKAAPVADSGPAPSAAAPPNSIVQSSARDIRTIIGINDKYQIMSELFGNDKSAYEEALNHINASGSAEAAIAWLRDRLWITEEHSDGALYFFEIVRRFFTQQ